MHRRVTRSVKNTTYLETRSVSTPTQTDLPPIKIYITDVEAFNKIFHSSDKRSTFPPSPESSSRKISPKTSNSIVIKSSTPKPQVPASTTSEVISNKSFDDRSSSDKEDGDDNNETSSSEVLVSELNSDNRLEERFDQNIADQMTDANDDGSMLFELSSIFNSSVALPDLLTSDETIVDINDDDERNESEGLSVSPPLLRKRSRSALMDFNNDSDDDERNSEARFVQTSLEIDEKKGRNLSFHIRSSTVVVHNHYYKQL